jgi:hypothetical protein
MLKMLLAWSAEDIAGSAASVTKGVSHDNKFEREKNEDVTHRPKERLVLQAWGLPLEEAP